MKLSTKIRYGARAMLVLASHYGEGPLELHEIAKKESISIKYLGAGDYSPADGWPGEVSSRVQRRIFPGQTSCGNLFEGSG